MTVRILGYLVLLLAFTSMPAYALDLHEARGAGLVAEKLDGYVAPLKTTPEIEALVQDVNAKRKQEYARISAENGQPIDIVAKLAAEQIINNMEPGSYYQASDGTWKTR